MKMEATARPWTWANVSGAGIEIRAPVYRCEGVELPKGMPEQPIRIFQFTAPQTVQIAAERWVQFAPRGWEEMQLANAEFIVTAVNSHDDLQTTISRIIEERDGLATFAKEFLAAATVEKSIVKSPAFEADDMKWLVKTAREALATKSVSDAEQAPGGER